MTSTNESGKPQRTKIWSHSHRVRTHSTRQGAVRQDACARIETETEKETEKVTEIVTGIEEKFPDRFWVSLGYELHDDAPDFADEFNGKLIELSNKVSNMGSLSYVTFDLEDAREVAKDAISLKQKYFPHLDDVECGILITTQPKCPKCGKYGRFSDFCCSRCGEDLELKQYIDIEAEEDDPDLEEDDQELEEYDQSVGYKPDDNDDIYCPYCEDGGDLDFDEEIWRDDDKGYFKHRCKTCGREIHAEFVRHVVWVQ